MTAKRLSRLQRDILAWLCAEDQRTSATMVASHENLVQAMKQLAAQEDVTLPEACFEAFREYLRLRSRTARPQPEADVDAGVHQG